jgi:glycosyltransferase involved in cell wall biosynthesis
MDPDPYVSVIIPVHNGADTIVDQLDALGRSMTTAPAAEIIVVDNRSTDATADRVRDWAHRSGIAVRIVSAEERASEPYARNVGFDHARGGTILYCDADDVVEDGWIAALANGVERTGFATGPLRTDRLNEAWMADVRGRSVFSGTQRLFDTIPFAHGANMGFDRAVLQAVGGFDEAFPIACDQVVAVRAWQHGVRLHVVEEAVVHYRLRSDLRSTFRQGRAYGRFRPRVQALVPDLVDDRSIRRAWVRRSAWVVSRLVPALWNREIRARVVWTTSGVVGEINGTWELRHDR